LNPHDLSHQPLKVALKNTTNPIKNIKIHIKNTDFYTGKNAILGKNRN